VAWNEVIEILGMRVTVDRAMASEHPVVWELRAQANGAPDAILGSLGDCIFGSPFLVLPSKLRRYPGAVVICNVKDSMLTSIGEVDGGSERRQSILKVTFAALGSAYLGNG
jgi:hypothetical protein